MCFLLVFCVFSVLHKKVGFLIGVVFYAIIEVKKGYDGNEKSGAVCTSFDQ